MRNIKYLPALALCLVLFSGCAGGNRNLWVQTEQGRSYLDDRGKCVTGWYEISGRYYYFDQNGFLATGWQESGSKRFYIDPDGTLASGWRILDGQNRHLDKDGQYSTGWVEISGHNCYFSADGTPASGLTVADGKTYFLNVNGVPTTGWVETGGKRLYFGADGAMQTGWVKDGAQEYYFYQDGTMAVGEVEIAGVRCHFAPNGQRVILVNPWNSLPADLTIELVQADETHQISAECHAALMQMLSDCAAAGHDPELRSTYRTTAYQELLHENKVEYYLERDYPEAEARALAATVVAVPGTSEHQLGLAADIADRQFKDLTDEQANTATQKWLMKHCWEYGFILRYPKGKSDITGIIYEPWHYRYVGVEMAKEITESGLTLEEYLGATQS